MIERRLPRSEEGTMRRSKWRVGALLAAGVLALAVAAAALGNTSRNGAAKADGGSLTVWLSGTYAGATPGSSYRKWLDGVKKSYCKRIGYQVGYAPPPGQDPCKIKKSPTGSGATPTTG
jgi:hypothetical protein